MDYEKYMFSNREKLQYGLEVLILSGVISYLFYRSIYAMVLVIPIGLFFWKEKKKELADKRRQRLGEEFKDGILAIATALKVGYSMENAVLEATKDLKMVYSPKSDIIREFTLINLQVRNNVVIEKLLLDFGKRSHVEDIQDFAEVFAIAKRNGGDFYKIIQNTAVTIRDKIEVKQEIETMITAKQFEQKIMNLIPILIIVYISMTSPHFFDTLYHNLFGVLIMTGCLLVYFLAILLARHITAIEI